MSDQTKRHAAVAGATAALATGLCAIGFLLAGGNAPRQEETTIRVAAKSVVTLGAPVESPTVSGDTAPKLVAAAPLAPPPVPPQPAVATAPAPARTRASQPPIQPRTSPLAAAWLAAGARNVDANAGLPAPAAQPASTGPAAVRLEIPSIGVDAPVDPTGLDDDGTMAVPKDFARTAFFTGRPNPGEVGPAIIIGHVDNRSGPAVFYRLDELDPGDEVTVERADASRVTFVVERSKQVPKNDFPTDEVYGPTDTPTLRLITCGGTFDRSARHYRDNVIVFLRMKG